MALTNCTITSASLTVTAGQDLGSTPDQVLVITPNTGYVVSAADFTNNSGSVNGITSITLTNSGNAYEANNTVLVTCNVDDNFSTSSNVTLTIDIDGEAKLAEALEYTIAGSLVQTICSTSLKENTTFNGSGAEGDTSLLFTKVVTVSNTSTHFFPTTPSIVLHSVGNYASNYTREAVNQVYTNGRLTSVTLKLYWTHPAENVAGHTITIDCPQVAIPTPKSLIRTSSIITSPLDTKGGTRTLCIGGTLGASYVITVTDGSDSDTYDFTTATFTSASTTLTGVIDSTGTFCKEIVFPANNSGSTYTITVAGGSSPATNTTQGGTGNNNPFTHTISQSTPVSLVVTATGSGFSYAYSNNSISVSPGGYYLDTNGDPYNELAFNTNITKNGGGNIFLRRQPVFSNSTAYDTVGGNDFTNTIASSNNSMSFNIGNLTATGSGTSTVNVSGSLYVTTGGTASVSSVLNAANFINNAPITQAITSQVSIANNTATTISLNATDLDNDPLTYSVVSAPSKGSVTIDTLGVATYTPAGTLSSGADSFTFKVNDGIQDSNVSTVNVYIQSSGQGGSTYSTPQVRWYQMDTEASSPAYGLITNSSYQGTATITNFANGNSSFNVQITDWIVTIQSGTMPSYVDNMGDVTIKYVLKLVNGNSVVAGPTVMNKLSGNVSGTNYSVGAMGATLGTSITTISVPGNINTSQEYRLEFMVEYDNIQQ
jgi:hypothetical protein